MNILPEEYSESIGQDLNVYYRGRVCTILVDSLASVQANMSPEEAIQSFTGVVNTINSKGICITDLVEKTRNFFFYTHVVGIREERTLDPDNPAHQEEIAIVQKAMEVKKEKKPVGKKVEQLESVGKESAFVNISDLQRLAKESKQNLT